MERLLTSPVRLRSGTSDEWIARETSYNVAIALTPARSLVLDLGAHVGTAAHKFASAGYPVIAVEAEPSNAELLRKNVAGLPVRIVEGAVVADESLEKVDFYVADDPRYTAMHRLDPKRGYSAITVRAVPIQRLLASNPVCVKMDVEGAEYELIPHVAGSASVEVLVVELHYGLKRYCAQARGTVDTLVAAGFRAVRPPTFKMKWAEVVTFTRYPMTIGED